MISYLLNQLISYLPIILVVLLVISALITLCDQLYWKKQRAHLSKKQATMPVLVDYARSFLPVFILVLVLRSFVFQPFKVPTGSLEPTVLPGDYLFVTQYSYGLRLPVWRFNIMPFVKPERGQIVVFHWPVNTHVLFVKRLVGMPGDDISYVNKVLTINGQRATQNFVKNSVDLEPGHNIPAKVMQEDLLGVKHNILIEPSRPSDNFYHLKVPKGEYLMMGDNRDNSDDSRSWGFVKYSQLEGRARFLFFSWDSVKKRLRFERLFHGL